MKKLFKKFTGTVLTVCIGAAVTLPLLCEAQAVTPKITPLTNAVFSLANGALAVPAATTTNLYSAPFVIYRDRGFALNVGLWSTNNVTTAATFVTQFATPQKIGGTLVTNWLSAPTSTNTVTLNGTNEVYAALLTAGATIQHVTLGRLMLLTTASASPVWLDPTNTFIGLTP